MFKELNILHYFFEKPSKEYGVRELAKQVNKAPATVSKELKLFAKKGILQERKERQYTLYKASIEHEDYRDVKVFYTIRKLKESGLIDNLNKEYLKPTIILFGSTAQGYDTEDSDIDLCVISEKTTRIGTLRNFEKKLQRKIQLFVVKDLKELRNEHLMMSVINGIKLQGQIIWT